MGCWFCAESRQDFLPSVIRSEREDTVKPGVKKVGLRYRFRGRGHCKRMGRATEKDVRPGAILRIESGLAEDMTNLADERIVWVRLHSHFRDVQTSHLCLGSDAHTQDHLDDGPCNEG